MAAPISSADHTVDSSPTENPDRIVVAGPVVRGDRWRELAGAEVPNGGHELLLV